MSIAADRDGQRLHLVAAGLNHRTAPVEVRETLAFSAASLPDALAELQGQEPVAEAAILSTCNRAELYAVSPDPVAGAEAMVGFLTAFHHLDPTALRPHLYHHCDEQAARHLFRVAAGLDSMVLGEGQILAQVKAAHQAAAEAGTARTYLQELFQRGLHIGKVARTETGIHRGAVSISSAAVDLAKTVFGDLTGRRALVVGAGEMSEQTLTHLVDQGVASVVVANRTHQRAVELASRYQGRAVRFDDFEAELSQTDIVVSSSAAPHPILTVEKLRAPLAARRGNPLFIVDIAVPRDVEAAVADLPNVYLFDIDDLQGVAERYREERAREVGKVETLVDAETARFMEWLHSRGSTELIVELRERVEGLRDAETERWLRRLPELDERQQELVRQMMRSFSNKLLHGPLTEVRRQAATPQREDHAHWVRRLFGLGGEGAER
ncbi:MAG: glutamyl-tRNA reductase [Fimbriimonadaceae bacterium]|nr:glutamyl-tRNA reductase [Fimbriimonadaceae bacterium]